MSDKKIVVAILDEGVFPWWEDSLTGLASVYKEYFGQFDMEYLDFADGSPLEDKESNEFEGIPAGDHGFWVLDRVLEVVGDPSLVKIVNCKVFPASPNGKQALNDALDYILLSGNVDLVNMSLGVPRYSHISSSLLSRFNWSLDRLVDSGGYSIISAGNESEVLSSGEVIDNTNWLASDENNNLSVASHNKSGKWDSFSSAGGSVDVSAIGSNLSLVGQRNVSVVSGTSFSAPTFAGLCVQFLHHDIEDLRNGRMNSKEIIHSYLDKAIKPVYSGWNIFRSKRNPWFGMGSFQAYADHFIQKYKRDVLRRKLFDGSKSGVGALRVM